LLLLEAEEVAEHHPKQTAEGALEVIEPPQVQVVEVHLLKQN
jgi:hypothetical protein